MISLKIDLCVLTLKCLVIGEICNDAKMSSVNTRCASIVHAFISHHPIIVCIESRGQSACSQRKRTDSGLRIRNESVTPFTDHDLVIGL